MVMMGIFSYVLSWLITNSLEMHCSIHITMLGYSTLTVSSEGSKKFGTSENPWTEGGSKVARILLSLDNRCGLQIPTLQTELSEFQLPNTKKMELRQRVAADEA